MGALMEVVEAVKHYLPDVKVEPEIIKEHDEYFKGKHREYLTSNEKGEVIGTCQCGFMKVYHQYYKPIVGTMRVKGLRASSFVEWAGSHARKV